MEDVMNVTGVGSTYNYIYNKRQVNIYKRWQQK